MYLNHDNVASYERDGYLLLPELFSQREVAAMLRAVEGGDRVVASGRPAGADSTGRTNKFAIWYDIGDDIWGAASTCPRIVNNVRVLMHEDIAFFHGKITYKQARSGGAWEWHQDYGYWYNDGFAFPHMMSAFVALDANTKSNGCLQVLRGSHQLGRLEHGKVGAQTGAEPGRIDQIEKLFERVHCEMTPGSVLFFHCNLLHTSAPNESDLHRRSFIMCYNALTNPQMNVVRGANTVPCPVGTDDAILKYE